MPWEMFDSGNIHSSYKDRFGEIWEQRPVIALFEKGIVCNNIFAETFSFKPKDIVNVGFDSKRKKLIFQRPITNEAALAAYKIQAHGKHLLVCCKKAFKKFENISEQAFPAMLNASEKIIEVQLS